MLSLYICKQRKTYIPVSYTHLDVYKRQDDTRTHKIFHALDAICYEFDLSKPIWLDSTIAEFKRHDKARFYQDNFVDSIDFDYLEIQIIEE